MVNTIERHHCIHLSQNRLCMYVRMYVCTRTVLHVNIQSGNNTKIFQKIDIVMEVTFE